MAAMYEFRRTASGKEGDHCTYCPLAPNEICLAVNCAMNYERIQAERATDGVRVEE